LTANSDHNLDPALRAVLTCRFGDGIEVSPIEAGVHASFTGKINIDGTLMFCKAARTEDARLGQMLGGEANINRRLGKLAPKLLADFSKAGWRVLIFEHIPGTHINLSPDSGNLELLTELVNNLHHQLPDIGTEGFPVLADQWRRLSPWRRLAALPQTQVPEAIAALIDKAAKHEDELLQVLESNTPAHTDLHALNILVRNGRAQAVDWAWTRVAPAWYDALMLAVRLREAGYSAQAALAWLATTEPSQSLDKPTRDAVLLEAAGMWTWLARGEQNRPHLRELTSSALDLRNAESDPGLQTSDPL
jgi:hypothetical protein